MTSQFDIDNMAFDLEVTEDKLSQLGALFSTIIDQCNNKEMMPTAILMRIKNLAGLGWSSADEWADTISVIRGNLKELKQDKAA